jgi:hypothetical protein
MNVKHYNKSNIMFEDSYLEGEKAMCSGSESQLGGENESCDVSNIKVRKKEETYVLY